MSALFNFHSFLTVVLLVICTCTFLKMQFPAILEQKTGKMFGLGRKKGKEASGSSQSKRRKGSSSQPQSSSDDENEEIIQWTERSKRLSEFNDKRVEANLWKGKMTEKGFKTEDALICENAVNSEELRMIGITQKFERIGWEAALDFCEGDHQGQIALSLIEEWMGSLSMSLGNNPPHTMTLTGTTRGGKMVMSLETMNQVALFDSLGADHYIYPPVDQFFSNSLQDFESVNMLNELFSRPRGQKGYSRDSMTCEGRLIQNINLENLLPRLGDRGIVRMWDARVVYSVIHGHPTFSFRYLAMLEVWESRDSYSRKSIPYPRLLTMLMKKQKTIPKGYKFHVVPVKVFDFAKLRKSGFDFEKTPQHNILRYRPSGSLITYRNDGNDGEQDDMDAMEMQGDEGGDEQAENLADTDSDQEDARRAVRMRARNQHMSDEVRAEMTVSRPTTFNTWSSYRQYMWEESTRQRVEGRLRWEASERNREERDAREAANWRHLHMSREVDRYNDYVYQNQVRHHQDFTRGLPYTPHAPYVDYSTIRDQPQEVQDAVTWPESISSSHIPYPYSAPPQEAPSAQGSALNDWREFQESLFGPPNPYPPPGPYDPYFR